MSLFKTIEFLSLPTIPISNFVAFDPGFSSYDEKVPAVPDLDDYGYGLHYDQDDFADYSAHLPPILRQFQTIHGKVDLMLLKTEFWLKLILARSLFIAFK